MRLRAVPAKPRALEISHLRTGAVIAINGDVQIIQTFHPLQQPFRVWPIWRLASFRGPPRREFWEIPSAKVSIPCRVAPISKWPTLHLIRHSSFSLIIRARIAPSLLTFFSRIFSSERWMPPGSKLNFIRHFPFLLRWPERHELPESEGQPGSCVVDKTGSFPVPQWSLRRLLSDPLTESDRQDGCFFAREIADGNFRARPLGVPQVPPSFLKTSTLRRNLCCDLNVLQVGNLV